MFVLYLIRILVSVSVSVCFVFLGYNVNKCIFVIRVCRQALLLSCTVVKVLAREREGGERQRKESENEKRRVREIEGERGKGGTERSMEGAATIWCFYVYCDTIFEYTLFCARKGGSWPPEDKVPRVGSSQYHLATARLGKQEIIEKKLC